MTNDDHSAHKLMKTHVIPFKGYIHLKSGRKVFAVGELSPSMEGLYIQPPLTQEEHSEALDNLMRLYARDLPKASCGCQELSSDS